MKILLRTYKYSLLVLGTVGCVLLYACKHEDSTTSTTRPAATTSAAHKVDVQKTKIVIKEPIKLSAIDEKKLDEVLSTHDKKLYLFVTWRDGKVVKVRGQGSTVERVMATTGMSREGDNWVGPGSVCPHYTGCPTANLDPTQKQLYDDLRGILAKY